MRAPWARGAAAITIAVILTGCAQTGDFDRPQPTFWRETIEPAAGKFAAYLREEPVAWGLMTDDEQQLRDRGWHFLMPARQRWDFERQLAQLAVARILPFDPYGSDIQRYNDGLDTLQDRSPRSRYRRLQQDMENDRLLLASFVELSCRVADMDRVRLKALDRITTDQSDWTRDQAKARVAENEALVAWVQSSMDTRIAGYRFALDRLVLATPDPEATKVERGLIALEAHRGGLRRCASTSGRVLVEAGSPEPRYTPRPEKPPLPPK